ncbi:glycosyltransferase family 2 protein [Wenyingzhuangia sp. IMCC45467]
MSYPSTNTPLVSIILPVYNGEKYIIQSIESCLQQTYKNLELIIVNDCSTDNTLAIAKEFQKKDDRIIIIDNQANKKLPASLNIGHKAAKGDLFTWTSDDNIYLPRAIETMVLEIEKKNSDFVYADFIQINDEAKELRSFKLEEPEELIWRNVIGACFLYKKEVYKANKGYNEHLFMVEDYDFWLRAFFNFKFYHINTILYKYRIHTLSLTSEINDTNSEKQLIYEKNKYNMYQSVFNEYKFPLALQDLILHFQKTHIISSDVLLNNFSDIKNFYQRVFKKTSYKKHLYYLKDKYIKGVRKSYKTQGVVPFVNMIFFFSSVMTFNDYKTALKIATHKILKK